ncbi:MAG: hypothetical protein QNJ36_03125 [Calothrix sp. MO_167.B42]|nr:hypothetical protein [Calothrix sp. MO_167.B42]
MATEEKVIPFTGYLQPKVEPSAPPPDKSPSPYILLCLATFIAGLTIGAVSIHQSANYQQMEELKAKSERLTEIRKLICY